jgi:hypothetical protein
MSKKLLIVESERPLGTIEKEHVNEWVKNNFKYLGLRTVLLCPPIRFKAFSDNSTRNHTLKRYQVRRRNYAS